MWCTLFAMHTIEMLNVILFTQVSLWTNEWYTFLSTFFTNKSTSTFNQSFSHLLSLQNSKTFQSSGKVIDADVDWNTITEVGVYKIQCHEHFKEDKNVPMINSISDFYNYGILLVFSPLVNDNEKRLIQIYIPDIMTSESNRSRIAIRSFNTSFRNWGIVNISNTVQ